MDFNDVLAGIVGDTGSEVPGLGVIVFKDGREIYSNFFGNRTLGKNPKPVTRHTRFRVASVSKMFTIFSIMQLVESGEISLDDDAGDLLGFELRNPNQPHEKITVRMLASHTSSLRDGKIYSLPPEVGISELFRPDGTFWEDGNHFAPSDEKVGKFFSYANLNYGVLGTVIEHVKSKCFRTFQKENILRQLDTKADYLPANFDSAELDLLGTIYSKKKSSDVWEAQIDDFDGAQPVKNTVALQNPYADFSRICNVENYQVGTNATFFSPQGGLRISFDELANTLEMILNDGNFRGRQVLSGESLATMFRPHWKFNPLKPNGDTCDGTFSSYGLGTYRTNAFNLVGHGGEAFGLLSGLFVIPNTKSGLVYMMNGRTDSSCNFGFYAPEEKLLRAVWRQFFL